MNNILAFLTCLFLLSSSAFAQNVEFEFHHCRRIPFNHVKIRIMEVEKKYEMSVESTPLDESERWLKTKRNYKKEIPNDSFAKLYAEIVDFYESYTPYQTKYMIVDGSTWSLGYGSNIDMIRVTAQSPEEDTQKRNLKKFVRVCKKIVEMSGLPVKDILGN